MFGTLHYNAGRNETQYVERSNGVVEHGGNTASHFACDNCRAKKLKCDGQRHGCFRCNASPALCSYTRYSNKRESQQKPNTNRRIRSIDEPLPQTEKSYDQRTPSDRLAEGTEPQDGPEEISDQFVNDNRMLRRGNSKDRTISNPYVTQGLGSEDDQMLFDRLLTDPTFNDGPQGEDPFAVEFRHSSLDTTIPLRDSLSSQLSSPDITLSSPQFSPLPPSFEWVDGYSPQWPTDHEGTSSHTQSSFLTSIDSPENVTKGLTSARKRRVCHCSQGIFTLLGKSESACNRVELRYMHIAIARVKSTYQQYSQILSCSHCTLLSDHMMLAAVVISKLVSILEEIFHVYVRRRTPRGDLNHQSDYWSLSVGEYMVDSEIEWAAVMKVLIVILLKRTLDTLGCLKRIAKANLREAQFSMLRAAEQKAERISLDLQSGDVGGSRT